MPGDALEALRAHVHGDAVLARRLGSLDDDAFAEAVLALATERRLDVTRADLDAAADAGRRAWALRWIR